MFWKTFQDCSSKLPKNVAAVFNRREVDGVEGKEICALLNISENNLWVMLHRVSQAAAVGDSAYADPCRKPGST